eukprot:scaffold1184_cov132-Cylindrotheca_fusiformis.AAC.54
MTSVGVSNEAIHNTVASKKIADRTDVLAKEASKLPALSKEAKTFVYTAEELQAIQSVYDKLTEVEKVDPKRIGLKALAVTTIVSKLRVDEATEKYVKFLKALESVELHSIAFSDSEVDSLVSDDDIKKQLGAYAVCGNDHEGRSIFWIKGAVILPQEETTAVKAGLLYWLAVHADDISLRKGVTFCIDTSQRKSMSTQGNESKLQKINQSYPLRPQAINIAGASLVMRVAINGLLKVASIFTKQKVLQRIQFVTMQQALDSIPEASAPKYLGGGGGNVEDSEEWIAKRIHSFPIPTITK